MSEKRSGTGLTLDGAVNMLYVAGEDRAYYYDRQERAVIVVADPFESDEVDEETERLVEEQPDRFVPFPGVEEIAEEKLYVRFARSLPAGEDRDRVEQAALGLHCRMDFPEALKETTLRSRWEDFREKELEALARAWAEANGIEFEPG